MDQKMAQQVIACLPEQRTLFYYFKDRYALLLLAYASGAGVEVGALKRSRFAPLLQKTTVQRALAECGDGVVSAARLQRQWPHDPEPYALSLGVWGGGDRCWDQTSRRGVNLVLRLNFSGRHAARLRRLVRPRGNILNYRGHPVQQRQRGRFYRDTLAWCRIDLDFDRDEALIEEIQSDWVSNAERQRRYIDRYGRHRLDADGGVDEVRRYFDELLGADGCARHWDEAMLTAAVAFIRDELGLKTIFYHHFDTGNALKGMGRYCQPPRSLYTALPRRFCFQLGADAPAFLRADRFGRRVLKKLGREARFYRLEF